jgi:hypothetical protein
VRDLHSLLLAGLPGAPEILQVDIAWFFDGLPQIATRRIAIVVPGQELPIRETTSLVEAYLRLKPNRRRGVFRLIQSMIESPTD